MARRVSALKRPDRAAPRTTLRRLRMVLWGLVVLAGIGTSWLLLSQVPPGRPAPGNTTLGKGDYRLETTSGQPFTEASLHGQPSLVFFGFTHCPDICPLTLGRIQTWQEDLGPLAQGLKVWFITVDPERDTIPVLRDYLAWVPGAEGVAGNVAETRKALSAFGSLARKVPLEDGGYTMDHTGFVLLFDREGRFQRILEQQGDPAEITALLRDVLKAQG